jgi:hypothetical protein
VRRKDRPDAREILKARPTRHWRRPHRRPPLRLGEGCETGIARDPSQAVIVNDLGVPVRLRLCDANDCRSFHPRDLIVRPGKDTRANVSAAGVPNVSS